MRTLSILISSAFLTTVSTAFADVDTSFMQGLGDAHYTLIDSEAVGRSYHVYVMLPDGYQQSVEKNYPTIYVLDGGLLFPLLTSYYRYLNFAGEIPEAIIVGISYGTDDFDFGNHRSTDYTAKSDQREFWGGADLFQRFLSDELHPYIEETYRSDAAQRVIFGQSMGGQFVLYTALTRPDLFWGHIASNPALHRNLEYFLDSHTIDSSPNRRSRLFVANGSLNDPRFNIPALKWVAHWSVRDELPWRLKTMILDGHSHMSTPPAAFRQGMYWLFSAE